MPTATCEHGSGVKDHCLPNTAVLKTSPERLYQDGYISSPNFISIFARCGQILRDLVVLPALANNRSAEFRL